MLLEVYRCNRDMLVFSTSSPFSVDLLNNISSTLFSIKYLELKSMLQCTLSYLQQYTATIGIWLMQKYSVLMSIQINMDCWKQFQQIISLVDQFCPYQFNIHQEQCGLFGYVLLCLPLDCYGWLMILCTNWVGCACRHFIETSIAHLLMRIPKLGNSSWF